jgi:hypothetical protein
MSCAQVWRRDPSAPRKRSRHAPPISWLKLRPYAAACGHRSGGGIVAPFRRIRKRQGPRSGRRSVLLVVNCSHAVAAGGATPKTEISAGRDCAIDAPLARSLRRPASTGCAELARTRCATRADPKACSCRSARISLDAWGRCQPARPAPGGATPVRGAGGRRGPALDVRDAAEHRGGIASASGLIRSAARSSG